MQATGNTDLIPWLTNYFYIYYPIVILLVCVLTIFSVGTRLASRLGYQKFIGEDEFSADFIEEGKTLMKRGMFDSNSGCWFHIFCAVLAWHYYQSRYQPVNQNLKQGGGGGGPSHWTAG